MTFKFAGEDQHGKHRYDRQQYAPNTPMTLLDVDVVSNDIQPIFAVPGCTNDGPRTVTREHAPFERHWRAKRRSRDPA